MHVHAPDHAVTTWRQFFIHLAIVSIGLLIALSLESLVEAYHHRALVAEARGNIEREIRENRELVKENAGSVRADQSRMRKNLGVLVALRQAGEVPGDDHLQYRLEWAALSDTAWTTARDTGALGHMDYAEVQCYAGISAQQQLISQQAQALLEKQTRAAAPALITSNPAAMTPAERDLMMSRSADLLADLEGIEQLMSQWDSHCAPAAS
ncbi:hypothetical protein P6166_02475 [Stenotrophomonas sp. HITSZ_GD]|uniref:hypothetical protein n=1 Tax=Stenotrophomonas sp. HITSZ_GD TaxID=3037248 RepID=UPI00240DF52F|nr:hypothetical protein [Stenotrophomonas sp. HITSZ_GD]MDG2524223.1 hypothetical protein [Stenotrophomonas sp. HITSZ_GD]